MAALIVVIHIHHIIYFPAPRLAYGWPSTYQIFITLIAFKIATMKRIC